MILESLQLKNYRCFETLDIDFDPHLTAIIGINGTGKSNILEAISASLSTFTSCLTTSSSFHLKASDARKKCTYYHDTIDVTPIYPIEITSKAKINEEEISWTIRKLKANSTNVSKKDAKAIRLEAERVNEALSNSSIEMILPVIAYYGTGRLWAEPKRSQEKVMDNQRVAGYRDCFDGATDTKMMYQWFQNKTMNEFAYIQRFGKDEGYPEFKAVKKAMIDCFEMMTNTKEVKMFFNMDIHQLQFEYQHPKLGLQVISLNELSDGYVSTISLVGDIAFRMAMLNPQLGKEVILKTNGIVLIDEIDLHLHPSWQQSILMMLQEIFPSVQFIVTTHAPAVVNALKKEQIRILIDTEVCHLDEHPYGKDVNSILNQIMDVSERPKKISELFQQVSICYDQQLYDEAEKLLDELETLIEPSDPLIASYRVKIDLRKRRRL